MQMVEDVKICSIMVSRMVNIPILGHFHRYVGGIEVTIVEYREYHFCAFSTQWPLLVYIQKSIAITHGNHNISQSRCLHTTVPSFQVILHCIKSNAFTTRLNYYSPTNCQGQIRNVVGEDSRNLLYHPTGSIDCSLQ
jgi:hypothetical protein